MKTMISLLAGLVLVANAIAQENQRLAHPESVISDGQVLYVTNVGKPLDPAAKDSNGYIIRLSLDGKILDTLLTDAKLHAPKGTAIIRGVLYVADLDRVIGILMSNGKKIAEIVLGQSIKLVNDLAVKDDFTLFASATDPGKIVELNIRTGQVRTVTNLKGANGLSYDKTTRKLYVCSFDAQHLQGGEVGVISWNGYTPSYEKMAGIHGAFDGIALVDSNTLVVSDWVALDKAAGTIQKIDLSTKKATKLDMPAMYGPADLYFDRREKKLFIPVMMDSKVVIQQL
ncbi:hypothetical protein [Longitalea luteola]|uniref:hypothetical protein n=1 Tax=Longitalea luteola TaxID=2812563 RepID=UPI001A968FE5|nr:hypothetical protein [Longitalea luteola]